MRIAELYHRIRVREAYKYVPPPPQPAYSHAIQHCINEVEHLTTNDPRLRVLLDQARQALLQAKDLSEEIWAEREDY